MSGKASRRLRKQKRFSNKVIAAGLSLAVLSMPVYSNGEVLVSVYPHFTAPITAGNDHDVQYGIGGGAKLTYRPVSFLDFSIKGDYMNLALPNVSGIDVINGSVEAGYHVNLSDRTALNFSCDVGAYSASQKDVTSGFTAGATLSFSYRINPVVSSDLHSGVRHYAAGNAALLTGASFSPGLTFNITRAFKNYSKIRLGEEQLKPVFPVLYSWYDNNSFGSVEIINEEDSKIQNLQVSFYQPQYMGQANVCGKVDVLEKGEKFKCDLTAFFNERMLDLTEKTDTQAIISVDYTVLGQKRHKDFNMVVPVYGRNSMSWDDDRSASVFVSSKDPAALWFSKYITSIVRDNTRSGVPQNIQYAMGIFDTLDQFGLNYVIDPSSAYADNVGTSSIDFLQFPYQTLMYRGGDCDDISILVCSLFEAVGIPTAFITIPGHIYMAFDSGLKVEEAKKQLNSLSNYIIKNDEVWVPLEITLTDEGFNKAWRVGAREWNAADKNGTAAFYRTHDSWKIYKPVSVPGATVNFTMPEREIVSKLFTHSIDEWIIREITPQIDLYNTMLAKNRTYEIQNSLGVLYGRYGLVMQADDQFKKGRRAGYVPSILNTANLYYSMQDFETARKWYREVLKRDKNNVLAFLGIAGCDYELENYEECDSYYVKVMNLDPDLAGEYSYLGAFENTRGRAFNLADRITHTVWSDDAGEKLMGEKLREEQEKPFEDIGVKFTMEALVPDADVGKGESDSDLLEPDSVGSDGDGSDPDEELAILDEDAQLEDEYIGLQNQISLLVPDEIFTEYKVTEESAVAALESDGVVRDVKTETAGPEKVEAAEDVVAVETEETQIFENAAVVAEQVESEDEEEDILLDVASIEMPVVPVVSVEPVVPAAETVEVAVADAEVEAAVVPEAVVASESVVAVPAEEVVIEASAVVEAAEPVVSVENVETVTNVVVEAEKTVIVEASEVAVAAEEVEAVAETEVSVVAEEVVPAAETVDVAVAAEEVEAAVQTVEIPEPAAEIAKEIEVPQVRAEEVEIAAVPETVVATESVVAVPAEEVVIAGETEAVVAVEPVISADVAVAAEEVVPATETVDVAVAAEEVVPAVEIEEVAVAVEEVEAAVQTVGIPESATETAKEIEVPQVRAEEVVKAPEAAVASESVVAVPAEEVVAVEAAEVVVPAPVEIANVSSVSAESVVAEPAEEIAVAAAVENEVVLATEAVEETVPVVSEPVVEAPAAIIDVSEFLSEIIPEDVPSSEELSEIDDLLASLKETATEEPEIQFYTEEPEFPVPTLAVIEEEPEEDEEETLEESVTTENSAVAVEEIPSSEDAYESVEIAQLPEETYEEEEEIEEEIDTSVVPRFSAQPSSEWAPEAAYTASSIPGMKSYELEMGNTQNAKAFLYEETQSIAVDPDKDYDIEVKADQKSEIAMLQADVNPFSSFLSEEDAKVVEKITNYKLPGKEEESEEVVLVQEDSAEIVENTEAEEPKKIFAFLKKKKDSEAEEEPQKTAEKESKSEAASVVEEKTVQKESVKHNPENETKKEKKSEAKEKTEDKSDKPVEAVIESESENVSVIAAETEVSEIKTEEKTLSNDNRKIYGGLLAAAIAVLSGASVAAKKSNKKSKKDKE